MKNTSKLSMLAFVLAFLVSASSFAQKTPTRGKNKFLEGKKYTVQFYEMKPAGRGKAQPSVIEIKGGKIMCNLTEDKMQCGPATYAVTLDSTYVEDDTPMRMVTFEADFTEEKNEFKWEATVINYDIEGTIIQLKSGVEKKKFEYGGSEKTKK